MTVKMTKVNVLAFIVCSVILVFISISIAATVVPTASNPTDKALEKISTQINKLQDSLNTLEKLQTKSGNIGVATVDHCYAWDENTKRWYSMIASGSSVKVVESEGNLGFLTTSGVYIWSKDTKNWYSTELRGSGMNIVGSNGNFGVITPTNTYAWSKITKNWSQHTISGERTQAITGSDIVQTSNE